MKNKYLEPIKYHNPKLRPKKFIPLILQDYASIISKQIKIITSNTIITTKNYDIEDDYKQ